ncbi:MAG: insulinase family protein [Deltaproteobacteria bacterium]|nr:insulinase family protein [Deltaproteobacteria bacterium]
MKRDIRYFLFFLCCFPLITAALSGCGPLGRTGSGLSSSSSCISRGWPHDRSDLKPDPSLDFGTLDNGFRFVIMKNKEPRNRVALYLDVQAGSLAETESQRGLAHFLEHMVFNGSTHFPPGTLIKYLQSIGMSFGADTNAHTSFNETVYNLLLPSGGRRDLGRGLLVMADYARGALLLKREIDRERGVILAEKRTRDSAGYRLYKKRLQLSLAGTRAARRLPIGTEKTIKGADSALLREFYDTWYRPDNMILVVVGDVNVVQARKMITERFGRLAKAGPEPACKDFGRLTLRGTKVLYMHDADLGYTELSISTHWNTRPRPDTLAWETKQLRDYIAASIMNNRLKQLVSRPAGPLTEAGFYSGIFLQRVGYTSLSARTKAGSWRQGFKLLNYTLRQALELGFSDQELARAKKELRAALKKQVETKAGRNSGQLASQIVGKLNNNEVILSPEQELAIYGPLLKKMTLAEVNSAFRSAWHHDNRLLQVAGTVAIRKPGKTPEEVIRSLFKHSAETALKPWAGEAQVAFPYLPVSPAPARIVKKEKLAGIGALRVVFAGGAILNVKKTSFKPNEVLVSVHFGNGRLGEPSPGLGILAESVVRQSGFGRLTKDELDEALAGHSVQVAFRAGSASFALNGRGLSSEFELILQLMQTQLLDPAFRPEAYRLSMARFGQMYKQMRGSVDGMMGLVGERFLAGGNPFYGMPPKKQFMGLKLEQIRHWLAPVFRGAPLEISVVGDIDPGRVIELTGRYLGTLHRPLVVRQPGQSLTFPAGKVLERRVATQINKALVVVAWPTADFWDISRTRRLNVLAAVFADRLRREIREKMGATYSPVVYNNSSRIARGYGVMRAMLTVAPQRARAIAQKVRGVGARLARKGLGPAELKRAVKPILTSIKDIMRTNRYWLESVLVLSSRHPEQLKWPLSIRRDFASITAPQISALAARYLGKSAAAEIIFQPAVKKKQERPAVSKPGRRKR